MVRELLALVNFHRPGALRQGLGRQVVVQAPADILGVGLTAVAPPGVGFIGGRGMQAPVDIDQTGLVEQFAHPGALFGQEARVLLIAAPVLQINLLVRHVDVAAQDELALRLELRQMRIELVEKTELGLLAFFSGRAAREIAADDGVPRARPVKAQLDITPLGVELARTVTDPHIAGLVTCVDAHARIALLLRKMKVAAQAGQLLEASLHIGGLRLDLLHANTIGPDLGQPGLQAFGRCRADAVEVDAA